MRATPVLRTLPRLLALLLLATAPMLAGCGGGGGDTTDVVSAEDGGADGGRLDGGGGEDAPPTADRTEGDSTSSGPVVIVTEFHPNPCAVSDGNGEWIELTNVTTTAVDIEGWTLKDDGSDKHVIRSGGPLLLEPGLSLVLGLSADTGANGGVTVDYVYRSFTMRNSGQDQIVLLDAAGAEVDRVAYDASWPMEDCAALQLSSLAYTGAANDDPANWCPSAVPYGGGRDKGTPGGPNAICVSVRCGDSVTDVELGEECDDGPANSNTAPDACRQNCKSPRCGDGVTDPGHEETCDAGANNADAPNACRLDCTLPACGDGITDPAYNEQCDDGPAGSETCTVECRLVGLPCPAAAGDLIITEIMRNSSDSQDIGEWVELYNPTATTFNLGCPCVLRDDSGDAHQITRELRIAPGAYLVLARSGDPARNGGLEPDYVYAGFQLGNSADQVVLECLGVGIDAVRYSDADGWPDDAAYSMSLTPSAYDAAANDLAANWCSARETTPYGDGSNYGTPGAANSVCGDTEPVDWCRLERPATIESPAGVVVQAFGRVREAGVTDRTAGPDPDATLVGQLGYGPDGSTPEGHAGWTWVGAAVDPAWDGTAAGAVDVDEYRASFTAPAPGTYDHAFRFSADGGLTWTYCDLDGSDDGYDAARAGALTTTASACFPNPCDEQRAPECRPNGTTRVTYASPGVCTLNAAAPNGRECAYPAEETDCAATGARCEAGACVGGARPPEAPGEVVISEILRDPAGVDTDREWFELYNASEDFLVLDGCVVGDLRNDAHTIAPVRPLLFAPGRYLVLAQSAATAVNGGVSVSYAYGRSITLGNSADEVVLTCGGVVIDQVAYGAGWPSQAGAALSLDPDALDADANDVPGNWCAATEPFGDGTSKGSPGVQNPPCGVDTEVDWCRYQWPLEQESPAGTSFTAYGRVYDQGVTDRSDAVDPYARLVGAAGYGPDGSDPAAAGSGWTWFAATPNPGWNGSTAGEPDNDEYQATVVAPTTGTWDLAFRFSLDGGQTWLYCDRDARAAGGQDGSADGYQPANAGSLTTTPSPCDPNPCTTPDAPVCQDATTAIVRDTPGVCTVVGGAAQCAYPPRTVNCATTGATCSNGVCVGGARPPLPGEVIFTEVMYDTGAPLDESKAEWFEVTNLTGDTLALAGCRIADAQANSVTLGALLLTPNQTALFVRVADPAQNGGLTPFATFGFGLNNTGTESLTLTCAAGEIDAVSWAESAGWPDANQASLSLDPSAYDAAANDLVDNWCLGVDVYFAGDPGVATDDHRGTPGALNPPCPAPDTRVDWCRYQWPLTETALAGTSFTTYGRVFDEGVTDLTTGVDPDPDLVAQAGYGPDGSDPSVDGTGWRWFAASGNEGWTDTEEPGNDEYLATFAAPAAGVWDLAYRFSLDRGATWTYCDGDAGEGADGSENGYQAANAGSLTTTPSPCDPNPCTADVVPAPECADGVTRVTYGAPGTCVVDNLAADCRWPETRTNCALTGGTCSAGACVGGAIPPSVGELIVTEIMYDTNGALSETAAEWIELTNVSADTLLLDGCVVLDASATPAPASLDGLLVAAGGRVLLARSLDPAVNGGLTPQARFTFSLNNLPTGDTITVRCGGTVIDTVTYSGAADWPGAAPAYSLALDPGAYTAAANDSGLNWCRASADDLYYDGATAADDHFGTPGERNPACAVADTVVDWCRLQWPLDETVPAGATLTVYGRVWDEGITDRTTGVDPEPDLVGAAGYGPDGSDPATGAGWTWFAAAGNPAWVDTEDPNNDEYLATFPAPAAGTYDLAYRFSLDGGATWLYCDRKVGTDPTTDGSADGYQPTNAGSLTTTPSPCAGAPCAVAPAPECQDATTLVVYEAPGQCAVTGADTYACTFGSRTVNCAAVGGTCAAGACTGGARAPAVGELIVTEIMYDTNGALAETAAEWIELTNVSTDALLLDGCVVLDASATPAPASLNGLLVAAGGRVLLARSLDPAVNGGLTPQARFTFSLNNLPTGDTITVRCGGTVIDTVTYSGAADWPGAAPAYSLALDPGAYTAAANDSGLNWCRASADDLYYDGATAADDHFGTPGERNPACAVADTVVDWCRLQWPLDETVPAGATLTVYGRVWDEGITDRTTGVDPEPDLVGAAGYGPDGSDPATGAGWTWFAAAGNPAWVDTEDPNNDEYLATFPAPAAGTYDLAYRFSLDGGATWLYCDRKVGTDPTTDGSADGYQPTNAGSLTTTPSPCAGAPCAVAPAPECQDATTLVVYEAPGQCAVTGADTYACTFGSRTVNCAAVGGTCAAGACTGGARAPAVGELIVTEIMYDTNGALAETAAEWIELTNVSTDALLLDGCVVLDASATPAPASLNGLLVAAGGRVLLARSLDPAVNGGLTPQARFTFSLNNLPTGDTITVRCGGTVIDTVTYSGAADWPGAAPAYSLALDPGAYTAAANDSGLSWCRASADDLYYDGATAADDHFGTPGERNPACAVADTVVDWCRFQHPLEAEVLAGEELTAYGRYYDEGLTDQTTGNDPAPTLVAQVGYGPDGSNPTVNGTGWTWVDAGANPGWNTPTVIEANNDEYRATFAVAAAGTYDLAFRFSLDLGATWLYCDRKVDDASTLDGSADGYQPANAGNLLVRTSVCVPNPCEVPPEPTCDADGVTVIVYDAPGDCAPDGGSYTCDWPETRVDCSPGGGTCLDGACLGTAQPPMTAGELVITEILYDTDDPLAEASAEWFEVVNTTVAALNLGGCVVGDGGAGATTIAAGLVVAPGAYALFVRSDVAAANGGLVPDQVFGFSLVNGGGTVAITCGTTLIDSVTYDGGDAFPNGRAIAIQLDPELTDAELNDEGGAWCLSTESYYTAATSPVGDHYGSPGLANPPCHDLVHWCRLQSPLDAADVRAGTPFTVYGRLYEAGITDVTAATDAHPVVWASVGYGPDGSNPTVSTAGWTFTAAVPNTGYTGGGAEADNDEYQATFPAPAAGTYDVAFRVSLDGGRSWTYCDRDPEPAYGADDGSADGYQPANAGSLTTVPAPSGNLFFSEYVEGNSNNKAVEIYNAGPNEVLLSSCAVRIYANGATTFSTINLSAVTLAAGDVFVLCHSSFALGVPADICDQFGNLNFNGDDAVELVCQGTTMDVIGVIGVDPGTEWGSGVLSTADNTIRRLCSVTEGNPDGWAAPFELASEWEGFAVDIFAGLGSRGCL
jgi:hypothetical protein